jgi:asparagine synthase (glutamine-hydrolysing)
MSIAGVWSKRPDLAASGLEALLSALPNRAFHRPQRVHSSPQVAFGYLATTATEEATCEATYSASLALTITGDVRLDNRHELISLLSVPDPSIADTALVLLAYARWQDDCAERFLGDFAFVIHDARRNRLFAARDIAGARVLYYASFADVFCFASHPGAIRAMPGLPIEVDSRAVVDYLGDFPEDEQATLLRAVRRLPPGCRLAFDQSEVRPSPYFRVQAVAERRLSSDAEYAEALRCELARAVACRLPRSARCGVMLSGGLDSSMVTALAAQQSPTQISSFSAVFDDSPECDERVYQGPVVRASGTEHTEVRPQPSGAAGDFESLCVAFGEPVPMGPHWLAWAVAEAAAARGVGVLLTGADGDRVVSHGAGLTAELAFQHRWLELVREVRAVRDFGRLRVGRVLAVHTLLPFVPEPWRRFAERRDPRRRALLTTALTLLRPDVVRDAGVAERLEHAMRRPVSTRDAHEQILTNANRGRDVELLARLGAHLGVEFRHPFFDRRVVELCLSFPGEQKRKNGWSRFVLRNAMNGLVPDVVRFRPSDTFFNGAFAAWNRPWARALLSHAPLNLGNLEPFVTVRGLARLQGYLARGVEDAALGPVDVARRCVLLSKWLDSIGVQKIASQ